MGSEVTLDGTPTLTFLPLCAIPRGECNVALFKRVTVGATCGGSGSWTKISATSQSEEFSYTIPANCPTENYCARLEIAYTSDCSESATPDPVIRMDVSYTGLCSVANWEVTTAIETFYVDANVVKDGAVGQTDSVTDGWSVSSSTFTFAVTYLGQPTFHDQTTSNELNVIDTSTAYSIRQPVTNAGRNALRTSCSNLKAADSRTNLEGFSGCSTLQIGDCFTLNIQEGVHQCGADLSSITYANGASSATWTDSSGDSTSDSSNYGYWSEAYDAPDCSAATTGLCCLRFELSLAAASDSTNCPFYESGGGRRLSSSNSRYLADGATDDALMTLSHTIVVARSGGATPDAQLRDSSMRKGKSDSGVAGWIPAAGVGGLLLLAGAVIAVTRRPSLLRGAFHGPTKVLPNEDN